MSMQEAADSRCSHRERMREADQGWVCDMLRFGCGAAQVHHQRRRPRASRQGQRSAGQGAEQCASWARGRLRWGLRTGCLPAGWGPPHLPAGYAARRGAAPAARAAPTASAAAWAKGAPGAAPSRAPAPPPAAPPDRWTGARLARQGPAATPRAAAPSSQQSRGLRPGTGGGCHGRQHAALARQQQATGAGLGNCQPAFPALEPLHPPSGSSTHSSPGPSSAGDWAKRPRARQDGLEGGCAAQEFAGMKCAWSCQHRHHANPPCASPCRPMETKLGMPAEEAQTAFGASGGPGKQVGVLAWGRRSQDRRGSPDPALVPH